MFRERVLGRLDGRQSVGELVDNWTSEAREQAVALLQRLVDGNVVRFVAPATDARIRGGDVRGPGNLDRGGGATSPTSALGSCVRRPRRPCCRPVRRDGRRTLFGFDPFGCQPGHLKLWPPALATAAGRTRQAVLADLLELFGTAHRATRDDLFDKATLHAALADCALVVHTFDKGHSTSGAERRRAGGRGERPAGVVPAGFAGHLGIAGPLVFPGERPCCVLYCGGMRSMAERWRLRPGDGRRGAAQRTEATTAG